MQVIKIGRLVVVYIFTLSAEKVKYLIASLKIKNHGCYESQNLQKVNCQTV
jgi:hypothetical protein